MNLKKGELYMAEIPVMGITSIQAGKRPVLIVQDNIPNNATSVYVVPLSADTGKRIIPCRVRVDIKNTELTHPAVLLCEQLFKIDVNNLSTKVGYVDDNTLFQVSHILSTMLDFKIDDILDNKSEKISNPSATLEEEHKDEVIAILNNIKTTLDCEFSPTSKRHKRIYDILIGFIIGITTSVFGAFIYSYIISH